MVGIVGTSFSGAGRKALPDKILFIFSLVWGQSKRRGTPFDISKNYVKLFVYLLVVIEYHSRTTIAILIFQK
jgi:hypothetical protein